METDQVKTTNQRPAISEYEDPVTFIKDMLSYRKKTEPGFSVMTATKNLRRVSPALISLILKGKRKITLDRTEEIAKLLALTPPEKSFLKAWLEAPRVASAKEIIKKQNTSEKKEVGTHILSDWINVYVKDCFQLTAVQENPSLIYKQLALYANQKRIDRSIQFLMREGHLRKTPQGKVVPETPGTTTHSPLPSKKIRQFHKGALHIAKSSLELFPTSERMANTMIIPLNAESYQQLLGLIQEFAMRVQDFAGENSEQGERLYQLIVNLSPTGGKFE